MPLIAVAIENSNSRRQVSRENLPVHTEKILIRDTEVNPRAVIEINKKLVSFKRELAEDSVEKTENVLKKLKSDNSTSFKFAGNKIQYEFNEEISSNISKIKRAVKSCCYDRVLELCDILEHKVYKRNKCIKLAEKSPAGWDTVKEYLSDELASDSEDEKKMRSAEFRALRSKIKGIEMIQREDNSNRTPSATAPNPDSVLNSNFRSFRGQRTTANPTDYCFACNQQGHWRKNCPFTNKTTQSRTESTTLPRN
ncbi:LOW QUALITY PROTEIN: hypothetical protein KUTeg_012835 [Tegillarca granosa]|uniref:CCHC-type domain-containing protein n=1 Tax=Tegillarca granosa TaxID=220873 RepID=A0ABQ9F246_TEGGR|nr:LOW QUALITY PROTEIN: hypothetical protein KUTeg_012835 [Tegillarca granosa]